MSEDNYIETRALRVEQPLGTFYVVSITAKKLLDVCYSDKAEIENDGFGVTGTQRKEDEKRQKEISDYIDTKEAAFPNSIILGANYSQDGDLVLGDTQWRIEGDDDSGYKLIVPSKEKLASIIDGQHRLRSFKYVESNIQEKFQLVCSVYLDLPVPYHAYLFSTINFNQKKVDRSLAYNLFGFDIDASEPDKWVPETLAVSIARRLNLEETPFKGAIVLGVVGASTSHERMKISMATIVDGILRLISKKLKRDRSDMMRFDRKVRSRKNLEDDQSPLRELFKNGYDEAIFEIIVNYFKVVDEFFWQNSEENSYINKTIGVQALFDVLEKLLNGFSDNLDGEVNDFKKKLARANDASLEFSDAEASGKGRTKIRNKILEYIVD